MLREYRVRQVFCSMFSRWFRFPIERENLPECQFQQSKRKASAISLLACSSATAISLKYHHWSRNVSELWSLGTQHTVSHISLNTKSVRNISGYPLEILNWNSGYYIITFSSSWFYNQLTAVWRKCIGACVILYMITIMMLYNYFKITPPPQKKNSSPYQGYKFARVCTPEVHIPLGVCVYWFSKVRM